MNESLEDVIHTLESWSKAYPISMFPDPTQEDIDYINAENKNLSARFFAHVGRHFINKGFTPAIAALHQLQKENAELKQRVEFLEDNAVMIDPEEMKHSFVYKHLYGDDMLAAQKRINNLLRKLVDDLPSSTETYNPKKHGAKE